MTSAFWCRFTIIEQYNLLSECYKQYMVFTAQICVDFIMYISTFNNQTNMWNWHSMFTNRELAIQTEHAQMQRTMGLSVVIVIPNLELLIKLTSHNCQGNYELIICGYKQCINIVYNTNWLVFIITFPMMQHSTWRVCKFPIEEKS